MAEDGFEKEMHDVDWAKIYQRQAARGDLTPSFCELLELDPGDRLLDLGCGPGYTTLRLVAYIAPGDVYALDRHRGALAYLEEQADQPLEHVHPIVGDITAIPCRFSEPIPTIAAFVLHHVEDPRTAIERVASALPEQTPFLLVEYRADAPGEFGPPVDHRISRRQATTWFSEAGFTRVETTDLPEEKYSLVFQR